MGRCRLTGGAKGCAYSTQPEEREDAAICNSEGSMIRRCWLVPRTDSARDTNAASRKRTARSICLEREVSGRQYRGVTQSSGPRVWQCSLTPKPATHSFVTLDVLLRLSLIGLCPLDERGKEGSM